MPITTQDVDALDFDLTMPLGEAELSIFNKVCEALGSTERVHPTNFPGRLRAGDGTNNATQLAITYQNESGDIQVLMRKHEAVFKGEWGLLGRTYSKGAPIKERIQGISKLVGFEIALVDITPVANVVTRNDVRGATAALGGHWGLELFHLQLGKKPSSLPEGIVPWPLYGTPGKEETVWSHYYGLMPAFRFYLRNRATANHMHMEICHPDLIEDWWGGPNRHMWHSFVHIT